MYIQAITADMNGPRIRSGIWCSLLKSFAYSLTITKPLELNQVYYDPQANKLVLTISNQNQKSFLAVELSSFCAENWQQYLREKTNLQ